MPEYSIEALNRANSNITVNGVLVRQELYDYLTD
jgi:hypothetical protein